MTDTATARGVAVRLAGVSFGYAEMAIEFDVAFAAAGIE